MALVPLILLALVVQRTQIGAQRTSPSPLTVSLSATAGGLEIRLAFPATDSGNAPLATLRLAKGTSRSAIESLTAADFDAPPKGVEIFALPGTASSRIDLAVSEGVDVFYRLRGCDGAVSPVCALSNVATARAGPVPVTFFFGEEELLFDAPAESCTTTTGFDISDTPARALRRSDGSLLLVCGNSRGNFFNEGPDFESLERNCSTPAPLDSNFDDDPAAFDYQRWVFAPYRDPASAHPDRIHVLLHKEFHDTINPPCTTPGMWCQFTSIGYAYSDDGGHSYFEPPLPERLVAALPYPWDPLRSGHPGKLGPFPYGYFPGSNIIKAFDGFYYMIVATIASPIQPGPNAYITVMRTADLEDPQSWRFWDGSGFEHQTLNPYVNGVSYETAMADPETYFAGRLDPNLGGIHGSLTFNTYLGKYMLMGVYGNGPAGVPCGLYYTVSNDLIHWTIVRKFRDANLATCNPNLPQDVYPAIIDHDDPSVNFEFADDTFEIYWVRYITNTDRDLVRIPVLITSP